MSDAAPNPGPPEGAAPERSPLEELEDRVLILAPTSRDALTSQTLLAAADIDSWPCTTIEDVCREAARGAGAAIVTAEAIVGDRKGCLTELLRGQPSWSDFPLIVLTAPGADSDAFLRRMTAIGHMTFMKRPVQVASLVSAVQAALRDRRRQYAVRRHLAAQKKAEEELKEADRRKDDFIALLAHELRNPLAPVRNGLQVIRLAGDNALAIAEARAMMERQLGHMVRLIDDLLDVSRISRNKMDLRKSRVLLTDVLTSAVETARPQIDAGGHVLTVALPPWPVFLDADLTRLAQVFSNLLTNSAKYTERGGHIRLGAEIQAGSVVVSVRDDGIGIPAAALTQIFDMFSQIDRSTERSTGGLGIGLALVKGLVEMHGGAVEAASDGEGKGSTFTVRLPILDGAAPAASAPSSESLAPTGPRRRILAVDDNRDSAVSLALMLKLLGNDVLTAHDGEEAIAAAERFRPDLILMDVGMPRMNGLEATRRIREFPWGGNITIIALTGWGQPDDRARSAEAGCNGHLVKPISLPDLEKLLVRLASPGGAAVT